MRQHEVLFGECLGGALYIEDFKRICNDVGFRDPREVSRSIIEVTDPELKELVGNTVFYSITYRVFKLSSMETLCEDYGTAAVIILTYRWVVTWVYMWLLNTCVLCRTSCILQRHHSWQHTCLRS